MSLTAARALVIAAMLACEAETRDQALFSPNGRTYVENPHSVKVETFHKRCAGGVANEYPRAAEPIAPGPTFPRRGVSALTAGTPLLFLNGAQRANLRHERRKQGLKTGFGRLRGALLYSARERGPSQAKIRRDERISAARHRAELNARLADLGLAPGR